MQLHNGHCATNGFLSCSRITDSGRSNQLNSGLEWPAAVTAGLLYSVKDIKKNNPQIIDIVVVKRFRLQCCCR